MTWSFFPDFITFLLHRLLNYRKNTWIHLNCALWSNEVYETRDGGLVNIPQICKRAQDTVSDTSLRLLSATFGLKRPKFSLAIEETI